MERFAIFDLDGTLLDTLEDLADACNDALRREGFPVHAVEPYRFFVGDGVYNLIKRCLPEEVREDDAVILRVKAGFDAYYAAHSFDKTRPYPGIPAMLASLKEAGLGLAVLSNKPDAFTKAIVARYFPDCFGIVLGQREGVPIKPDPAAVFEIMEQMVAVGKGFYIGDTSTDMQTGKAAELYTIGVSWGFRTVEELEIAGADSIVHKSEELLPILVDK